MAKYQKQHPGKTIGHTAIQTYNRAMAAAGIFDVIHHRQDSEHDNPGAYESTEYHVRFSRVLVGDGRTFEEIGAERLAEDKAGSPDIADALSTTAGANPTEREWIALCGGEGRTDTGADQ